MGLRSKCHAGLDPSKSSRPHSNKPRIALNYLTEYKYLPEIFGVWSRHKACKSKCCFVTFEPRPFQEGLCQLASPIRHREADGLYIILTRSPKVSPTDAGHIPRIQLPDKRDMKIAYKIILHPCNFYTHGVIREQMIIRV